MNLNLRTWARSRFDLLGTSPATPDEEQAALAPATVRRGLRLSILEGSFSNIHIQLTMGSFLTGFALLVGATPFELGVLGALPFIAQLCQFLGAYLQERLGERRRMVVISLAISRGLWAPISLLPFLPGLGEARLPLFLLLAMISQALSGIGVNGWISWMGDLVPQRQRGAYFGLRNAVLSVTTMGSTWIAGRALDHYRLAGDERAGYAVIWCVAVGCALLGAAILWRQPEPPLASHSRVSTGALLSAPWRHRAFRTYVLTVTGWTLVTGIAAPFFMAYGLQELHISFATLALMNVVASAMPLVTQPLIGRLQDRYGDKRVLVFFALCVVPLPWGWIFSTPSSQAPLWVTNTLAGLFWPAIAQSFFNLLLERAPAEGRGGYIASYGMITGVGTLVAGLAGGLIAGAIGPAQLDLGLVSLNYYTTLFALSSLGRLAMAIVFARKL